MKNIIEVNSVTKEFQFRGRRGGTLLREEMAGWFRNSSKEKKTLFTALEDVSFDIRKGESIGIIGSNGAGKSTLLKILSRITMPTSGTVTIRGSVSSILEVGTGFHPELTGRENIFFSGALRGLSARYIRQQLDEIVDFSGVEHYLDMPFKHYSSGMQVRLAFAILSHIASDVFITDEVLAVGDAHFQKKSLKKMEDIFNQGSTIIFVSHQQSMISALTNRCLLLENGKLIADGPTSEVIRARFHKEGNYQSLYRNEQSPEATQFATLTEAGITDMEQQLHTGDMILSQSYKVYMEFEILQNSSYQTEAVLQVKVPEGYLMFSSSFRDFPEHMKQGSRVRVECILPGNLLNIGQYTITWSLISRYPIQIEHFIHEHCLSFGITRDQQQEIFNFYGDYTGVISPRLTWHCR